mgnify:CR=1 FL=1
MKLVFSIFEKLIPLSLSGGMDSNFSNRNYRRLNAILVAIMLATAIVPMLMAAGLGFKSYNELFRDTERAEVQWQLDGSIKSMEYLLHTLESIVLFVARDDRYEELNQGSSLEELFFRLQRQYGYFSDLGVIDENGIQQNYYGPYDLEGIDYSEEEWFKEVLDRGVYISKVYTGYREIPHFAMAVSKVEPKTRKRWVLRSTIEAGKLQKFVNTIKNSAEDDFFLIDNEGKLQTSSQRYGEPLSHFLSDVEPGVHRIVSENGESVFRAVGAISHTPWSLVIINPNYIHGSEWKTFRARLLAIVLFCIVTSIFVVVLLVNAMTRRLQMADELQITMLKEAEQTEKLASIGRLAAGVGHEINNPLAIIDQRTGLMEDLLHLSGDFTHKDAMQEGLAGISRSVERCKVITHRLLGFARRNPVTAENLQINQVIAEVLQFLDSEMLYNKIRLNLKLSNDLPVVVSDRTQLQQVFLNIIKNAIDAIDREGTITISSNCLAGDIRVVIEDDGPGIPEEIIKHIFEPFYTTKETGKGTGLGLSITFGLLKKLGGDITVRSKVGVGTAFTITIPPECYVHDQ